MLTERHFAAAPWSATLKASSALATLLLIAVGLVGARAIPVHSSFTRCLEVAVAAAPIGMLVLSLLFMVKGYVVSPAALTVQRPLWGTRFALHGLRRVYVDPSVCAKSIRVFGNGGLFAFTGVYRNARLGNYRLFGTDLARSVVLEFADRILVLTPADPQGFLDYLQRARPALTGGA